VWNQYKKERGGKKRKQNTDPPTIWEAEYHIQKTKNNKAPGEDNIVAELIKHGGEALVNAVHKLIRTIWATEKMPERWKLGIICPLYKMEMNWSVETIGVVLFVASTLQQYICSSYKYIWPMAL